LGGVVNVAIRLKDGRAFCQERWTNTMPHWFQDPKMFDGDEDHVMAYINAVAANDWIANPHAPGIPQPVGNSEYGLVVWDFLTGTILDNNHYSCPVEFDVVHVGGDNRRESFVALAQAGRIFQRTYHFPPRAERGDPDRRGGDVPFTDTPILSPEDALRLGEEAFQSEFGSYRPSRDYDAAFDYLKFMVKADPMTYFWMRDHDEEDYDEEAGEQPLSADYLAKLKEIGFPMTEAEGLNAHLPYTVPEPRDITEQEELARDLYLDAKNDVEEFKGISYDDLSADKQEAFLEAAGGLLGDRVSLSRYRLSRALGAAPTRVVIRIGGPDVDRCDG
jgi:hypothetical protein